MNAIINSGGETTMSSRDIADLCETRHNQVVETIERLFAKGVLRESRKTTRTVAPEGGGRPMQVYDLTKRDTLVVASGYNDELRARIIDRWQELEAAARTDPMKALADPAALRTMLLGYSERVIELEARTEAQAGEIAALAPQAAALERIAVAEGSLSITEAAKALQMGPRALGDWMRANGWTYRRPGGGSVLGYQSKVDAGLLEHKVGTVDRPGGVSHAYEQVRVTPKGLTKLAAALDRRRAA